ncbi:DUF3137 domain-containing protein [Pseudoalteromonas piscicida]|uniref:DUF3137 domain-containing protein n=1 Tax=Pseudoalteromonas piscicida TaxID=43662 RepID=UPI0005F9B731|nr:DUF3137 domain-containing protein [Pseudoalteromonas piscicida]KJZ03044.1 hypothetical protein TW73_09865 [Pseudoalteromonas piscicida]
MALLDQRSLHHIDPRLAGVEMQLKEAYYNLDKTTSSFDSDLDNKLKPLKRYKWWAIGIAIPLLFLAPFLLISIIPIYFLLKHSLKSFTKGVLTRAYMMAPIASALNLEYSVGGNLLICEEAINAGILTEGGRAVAEDGFNGEVNGIHFYFTEVHIRTLHQNNDSKRLFNGAVIKLSMPEPVDTPIVVLQDAGLWNMLISRRQSLKGLQRVKLEQKDFEKEYQVYAKDEQTCREVLTPEYMAKLSQVKTFFSSGNLPKGLKIPEVKAQMFIEGSDILISLDYGANLFSPKKLQNEYDPSWAEDIAKQFLLIENLAKSLVR